MWTNDRQKLHVYVCDFLFVYNRLGIKGIKCKMKTSVQISIGPQLLNQTNDYYETTILTFTREDL